MVSDSVQQDVISTENKSMISKKNVSTNEPKSTAEPDEDVKPVPLPRNCSTIKVCFTARPFPTPQRESQAPEEEEVLRLYKCSEWICTNCALYKNSIVSDSKRQTPIWCLKLMVEQGSAYGNGTCTHDSTGVLSS